MGTFAWLLAEEAKKKPHWIWMVLLIAVAILVIVRGVLAIRNKRIRLKYGIVKEGQAAVAWGIFFVVAGAALIVVSILVSVLGPLA